MCHINHPSWLQLGICAQELKSDGDRSVRDSWNRMIILMFSLNLNYEPAKTLISHVLSAIRSGSSSFPSQTTTENKWTTLFLRGYNDHLGKFSYTSTTVNFENWLKDYILFVKNKKWSSFFTEIILPGIEFRSQSEFRSLKVYFFQLINQFHTG